jgi:triphosphoribosyl-dephospho-CoA synthetase
MPFSKLGFTLTVTESPGLTTIAPDIFSGIQEAGTSSSEQSTGASTSKGINTSSVVSAEALEITVTKLANKKDTVTNLNLFLDLRNITFLPG